MADPLFEIEVDTEALLAALDRIPDVVARFTKPVAKDAADRIAAEAQRRVARRSGLTAAGIHVEEDFAREGYVVLSERNPMPNLPGWLERGTEHMTARPYFFNAGFIEEGSYERRIREAIQDAIHSEGFGEE
jgi:hypothetical protein